MNQKALLAKVDLAIAALEEVKKELLEAEEQPVPAAGKRKSASKAASTPAPEELRCPNCGTPYTLDSAFCMQCGQKLNAVQPSAASPERGAFCMNCGAPVGPSDSFCMQCGAKVQ